MYRRRFFFWEFNDSYRIRSINPSVLPGESDHLLRHKMERGITTVSYVNICVEVLADLW